MSLYAQADGVKVSTPYGEMEFSDDDKSSDILNEFAKACGDHHRDSLNTRAIISVCEVADCALAEIMDYICFDDFFNKPDIVAEIYRSDDKKKKKYIDFIALELCIRNCDTTTNTSTAKDRLADTIAPKVKNKNNIDTLSIIIAKIECAYDKYKVLLND